MGQKGVQVDSEAMRKKEGQNGNSVKNGRGKLLQFFLYNWQYANDLHTPIRVLSMQFNLLFCSFRTKLKILISCNIHTETAQLHHFRQTVSQNILPQCRVRDILATT